MDGRKYVFIKAFPGENVIDYIERLKALQQNKSGQVVYGLSVLIDPDYGERYNVFLDGTQLPVVTPNKRYKQVSAPLGTKTLALKDLVSKKNIFVAFNSPDIMVTSDEIQKVAEVEDPDERERDFNFLISEKSYNQRRLQELHTHNSNLTRADIFDRDEW